MSTIGYGYGSEWHLLRYLGYHRADLAKKILMETGGTSVEFLDFNFSKTNKPLEDDKEFEGLEFISDKNVLEKWKSFWPQSGTAQNWDAVAKVHYSDHDEWLLIEAKGHTDELNSKCEAVNPDSIEKITTALDKTRQVFGINKQPIEHWLEKYYQYANRLAVLHFLMDECSPAVPTQLLYIYFYGDKVKGKNCPQYEYEWSSEIIKQNESLGIDQNCELIKRVHKIFLPVSPQSTTDRPIA